MSTFTIPIVQPGVRSRISRRARLAIIRIALILIVLAIWEGLYLLGTLPSVVPDVIAVAVAIFRVVLSGVFWVAMGQTLFSALIGWLIAAVAGVVLGVAIGTSGFLTRSVDVLLEFGRSFPMIALLPMVVLVIGVNSRMEIFMVSLSCLWPILIQSIAGSRRQDAAVVDTARAFRVSRFRRFSRVTVPGALPLITTGLRIAASIALLVEVGVGVLSQTPGVGRQITLAQEAARWDVAFGYILLIGIVGWGFNTLIKLVERRALRWARQEV